MLKATSALEGIAPFATPGLRMAEAPDFALTQIAGDEKALKKALGKLPDMGKATGNVIRVAPSQFWILGDIPEAKNCFLTPLSSSRTRILIAGEKAVSLLKSCAAIDFATLKSGDYVLTGMHHVPVLVHCIGEGQFHLYVLRTFSHSIWDWLVDATQGL